MNNGPKVENEGLVLALDAASTRSTSKSDQKFNLLPDAGNWTTGTGGQTGYSPNGSSSEQNRLLVSDDPWGRSSVTWRTTPDSTSGADGGWNTSFYSCDRTKTYRMSIWVRRYTSGTGGTFYFGLYFSPTNTPMRVDNGSLQGNPYFVHDAISDLEYNQWYLVVHHVHPYGYDRTKGDHRDSGWYKDGKKIASLNVGNTGGDVVFLSDTTSIKHRTYHYYTTNTSSGLEFADPRIEVLTPKTPKVRHLIKKGASGWKDLKSKTNYNIPAGMQFTGYDKQSSFDFDGTDDYINLGDDSRRDFGANGTIETIFNPHSSTGNNRIWCIDNNSSNLDAYLNGSGYNVYMHGGAVGTTTPLVQNQYNHLVVVYNAGTISIYVNGNAGTMAGTTTGYNISNNSSNNSNLYLGAYRNLGYNLNGEMSIFKIYNQPLTADEVKQNFNAYRKRFNL